MIRMPGAPEFHIVKNDYPQAKYGVATLCGGLGNANAILLERVEK